MVCIIAAIISVLLIANKKWIKITKFKSDEVKEELKESWPLFLSQAATSIYTAMFIIILGFFATAEDVGQYSAADRLMRASCQLILFSTLQVFYPKVSRLAKEDRTAAVRLSSKLLKIITGLMIFIWAILFFGSTMIIELLGKDYKGGELLFRIMAFVPIFVGISGILGQCYLLALGNEKSKKLYTHTYFIAGGIAMLSVLILTSALHGVGTAIALLITEIAVVINMGRGMRTI
jgi:O-antigen/teichoic acid export membrane protein